MWYVDKHLEQEQHASKKLVNDLRLAVKNLPYPVDVQCDAIGTMIEKVAQEHSLTVEEVELRKRAVSDLETFIKATLPDVRLNLHGSSGNGFGLKTSNVNIDLTPLGKADCAQLFVGTGDLLQECPKYAQVTKDYLSKVPRIRFKEVDSKLSCEISLNNSNSQKTSKLLDDYASLDRRVKILGVAFRLWAKHCGLDQQDRGTLPPHAFAIMTVFFLQQCKPAVLPVLHEMKDGKESESYLKPKDLEGRWSCKNDRSIGQLWVELLRFYAAEFKLNKRVVCIRRSQPMLIVEKKWNKRYIAIEDPYSCKRNLARSIPSERMYLFLKRCICTSAIYFLQPQLHIGPMFVQLPGPPMYTENSESESESDQEEDNTKRKERHDSTDELAGAKATDDEDEEEEDDDDASSCSSGPAHDTDEQDPDLSFAEVAKVVTNLDLGPDPVKSKSHKKKETSQPAPQAPPVQQFVKPGPPIPQRILDDLDMCTVEDFSYSFSRKTLANGRSPPVICSSCQKSGHLHEDCPDHRLPELKPLPDMTRSYTKILNDVCQDVMKICTPDPEEEACREKLLRELESFIRKKYKDAKLTLYGSSCNGFGLIRSDLDICLTFEHSKDGKDFCHKEKILDLAKELNDHKNLKRITAITSAKVPIVKFYHRPTQLEGDISFYNTLAQHNTRLLKVYSQIDERVRVLGYTFKHFAKTCAIGDASRGSLSSYAYILLTLYYLQQCKPPVIPVLQELYPEGEQKPEVMVEGWNAWFYDDVDHLQSVWSEFGLNNETVGELWLGLLRFYTEEFNFQEHVVSIRQKAPLTRLQKMWTSKFIAIEDPFDLDHNLGSGVTKSMSTYIMKTLIKGRSHFGTPVRRPPAPYATFLAYFFDARNLVEGSPPNDRGCRICGKIGHRMKQCPNRNKNNGGKDKDATGGNNRGAWAQQDQSGGPRNFKFRPRQPHQQNVDPEEMNAEQQPNRENLNPQRLNQSQLGPMLHRRPRAGALPPRQARNRAQEDQRHASHHQQQAQHQHQQQQVQHNQQQVPHQQQQAQHHQPQGAPAEGHPGLCPEVPHGGIAPPGVAQAQLQRTLQNMATAGLQMGASRCFVPHMGPPPAFMATPPLRPPPFPGANGQTPPHPDVQVLLMRMQQQQQQQQPPQQLPQEMGHQRYGQWPLGPPSRHTMPSSWPPSLPPPHSQEALQHFSNFLGPRGSHNLPPPHPQAMPLPPSPQQQQSFLCGPPSKPPFSAMPSQPVFPGALCSDHPSQQWDTQSPHRGHEVESVPSQD
ncbi:terminal uridylyltransferase 7 [Rhipicephalus sanguineus]|uniref:terminal uridylyltransferase 7 n=1 Tax=Rhipicephalus sanguineus TaxID=34632 RepID=UPI001895623B|nr:terminal uridylyltransferase 7 [Rhipicephalus sanguineus]